MVQLPLAEHEGNWAEALVGHDLLLHHHAIQHGPTPKQGSQVPGRADQQQQQGLFNALQQLGCQHVLQKLFLSDGYASGKGYLYLSLI